MANLLLCHLAFLQRLLNLEYRPGILRFWLGDNHGYSLHARSLTRFAAQNRAEVVVVIGRAKQGPGIKRAVLK